MLFDFDSLDEVAPVPCCQPESDLVPACAPTPTRAVTKDSVEDSCGDGLSELDLVNASGFDVAEVVRHSGTEHKEEVGTPNAMTGAICPWEVVLPSVDVHSAPGLDAAVVGVRLQRALIFEDCIDSSDPGWCKLPKESGYIFKGDPRGSDQGIEPFILAGIPVHYEQTVLGTLREGWEEVQMQCKSLTRSLIHTLREAADDSVGQACGSDTEFNVEEFGKSFREAVQTLLATETEASPQGDTASLTESATSVDEDCNVVEEDPDDGLSEVWPGDTPDPDADEEEDSDRDDDVVEVGVCAWEVIFSRVVVRGAPDLNAGVIGICSQRELVFEDEGGGGDQDWVTLSHRRGFILKDGRKKDPKLGLLLQPFALDNVPLDCMQNVLAILRDGWEEVQKQSNYLKPSAILKLRNAADDAVGRAHGTDFTFDVAAFAQTFRRTVKIVLATENEAFAKKVETSSARAAQPGGQRFWNYNAPTAECLGGKITAPFVRQLLRSMKQRSLPCSEDVSNILSKAAGVSAALPSLLDLDIPPGGTLHVVGDIHGQYWDFLNVIELCGEPSQSNQYLFNGDFVDRGSFSVEVAIALLAMKVAMPGFVHLNRGNHEAVRMNSIYGFMAEAKRKYDMNIFTLFSQAFMCLPVATVVNKSVFVVHGGLGSNVRRLEDIAKLDRKKEPDEHAEPLMVELLWSDPSETPGCGQSPRGGGVLFGPDITQRFCRENDLICVIRSHEMKQGGYEWHQGMQCLTVFSAPNYCGICGNSGAVCDIKSPLRGSKLTRADLSLRTFEATDHPHEPSAVGGFL